MERQYSKKYRIKIYYQLISTKKKYQMEIICHLRFLKAISITNIIFMGRK
jgi:hypothetical protein